MQLKQTWPAPSSPRPIVLIGAGGIVNDAHLPAYAKAGFKVAGIFDVDPARAADVARKFAIPVVYDDLRTAAMHDFRDVVYDVAVPPEHEHNVLTALPRGSVVLMQKPMGKDLADARRILALCCRNHLTAAVNFQLRFAPMMLAVRDAIDRGMIGRILDVEVRLNLRTPWELFPFLKKLDRVEISVHSVHYLDLIRSLLGEPRGAYARTVRHPAVPDLKQTRTSIILDYGDDVRVCLSLNHVYEFGPEHEAATVSIQGTEGAVLVQLGLLLNYPHGKPETVRIATRNEGWTDVPVEGKWFPDGFVGTMSNLQRFAAGEDKTLVSHYNDAYRTMALVEACYASSERGATPIPE